MCGATAQQQQLTDEEIAAYQEAQQLTAQQYGAQSAIYAALTPQFESIFNNGPNQQGFSQGELNNLNTQAVEGTAQNYRSAAKAVGENIAAEGGGVSMMPTGGQEALKAQTANSAAQEESSEENQIGQANYQQGYNQWQQAAGGLESIATGENPLGYENAATGAGQAATTAAKDVADEQNGWINAALGAAGSLGGAAITAWGGKH